MTTARDGDRDAPALSRPRRPAAVELAAAILIVSGALSIPATLEVASRLAAQGLEPDLLLILSVGLAILGVVLGILVRYGRAWLVTVNVVAIAGFLELISGTPGAVVFGALDVLVVVILMVNRPWFAWSPDGPDDPDDPDDEALDRRGRR